MKKLEMQTVVIFGALLMIGIVLVLSARNILAKSTATNPNQNTGYAVDNTLGAAAGVQRVQVRMLNYQYVLEPSTLKKGVPVQLVIDLNSVAGCMREIVIPAFNVRKVVTSSDNIVEFTPDKAGTFNIVCGMSMGKGTFSVVEPDGATSAFVEQPVPQTAAGGCAGSGSCQGCAAKGSCGCGGG